MKKNNKGFTLVELIVVLVILAILAAILVPALLGWIDKAREKSTMSNAEAAYVAAQGLATEYYGSTKSPNAASCKNYITGSKIQWLTDIAESYEIKKGSSDLKMKGSKGRDACKIAKFTYANASKTAVWEDGEWTVTDVPGTNLSTYSGATGTH